ncbi:hypothetical protein ACWCQQ_31950 [Streptomyces sp. NPDC002143]
MRIVEHYASGPHKLLRVEAEGCAVNIVIGLHSEDGSSFTAIEVEPRLPDEYGAVWETDGATAIVVRRRGLQMLAGDRPYVREEAVAGSVPADAEGR